MEKGLAHPHTKLILCTVSLPSFQTVGEICCANKLTNQPCGDSNIPPPPTSFTNVSQLKNIYENKTIKVRSADAQCIKRRLFSTEKEKQRNKKTTTKSRTTRYAKHTVNNGWRDHFKTMSVIIATTKMVCNYICFPNYLLCTVLRCTNVSTEFI